ncbi:hypothetical protein GCM10010472_02800 [Pseudonocardia halophobica]|uniref:Glyoxalase/bleomycin resistance protein/dioxygenase superfamily protein n=1 Tax=Pseudonocardia halophobica TaxID=29401 RepID=A0A9W6L0M7_9PSEU|nr:VOC family protein [Pseudonocardia halophobica]GLL10620.1 hypothetical protein GCM10017577_17600 [Pseudonocardia halophobica]
MTSTSDPAGLPRFLAGRHPTQISMNVPDLVAGVRAWSALLGRDDWSVYSYDAQNTEGLTYRGEPGEFAIRLALCGSAPQIELVETLRGPNIYTEWIEAHGYGMHHLGYHVEDVEAAIASFRADGFEPIQTGFHYGLDGDGGFAYYEIPAVDPIVVEVIEVPRRRKPSETLPGLHT